MASYSALEAISPAIERTKFFLFKPFRLGRFLKLALVAALTEGTLSGFNFNLPFPGQMGKHAPVSIPPFHWPSQHWASSLWIAIAVGFVLLAVPLCILLSYLLVRLRFAYFDCLISGQDQIAPAWRKYHRQALRYLGVSLCLGLASMVVMIGIGLVIWVKYEDIFKGMIAGQKVDVFSLIPALLIVFLIVSLLSLAMYVVNTSMSHFVLPKMALEDASVRDAFEEVWAEMKAEKGQFALFLLMRILLPAAASLLAFMVLIIPVIVVGAIAVAIGFAVHSMAASSAVILIVLAVVGVLLLAILAFVVSISVGGTIGTFTRNYGILFYAGRYPELAFRLWPPPPLPLDG
jgi:hypothetical protein